MTAPALASPLACLNPTSSANAAGPRPRESAAPGAFARELEQAEGQPHTDPQTASSTPTSAATLPVPDTPNPARPANPPARKRTAHSARGEPIQARTGPALADTWDDPVRGDPAARAGKTVRPGFDPGRLGMASLRHPPAAAADAATDDGKATAESDRGHGPPVDAAALQLGVAQDPALPATPATPTLSAQRPAGPGWDAALPSLDAPSGSGQARPDAGLTEIMQPARIQTTILGPVGAGVVQQGAMRAHPGSERAERPALASTALDPQFALPGQAGSPVAAELASARLQRFVPAPVAELPGPADGNAATSPALPSFAADLLRASPPAAAPQGAAPTRAATELNLPTPVNSPEFVPRLSGELAVLARDGVQEARVQVNPQELGPIAVRITLEGNQAQVHLVVDNPQTRELLEQSMPSLAAALRETGLTLTGGGVFQQARQDPREAQGTAARGAPTAPGGEAAPDLDASPASRIRHLGVLDTYA